MVVMFVLIDFKLLAHSYFQTTKMIHTAGKQEIGYIAEDHWVTVEIIYCSDGKVSFDLLYHHGLFGVVDDSKTTRFEGLTSEEIRAITEGRHHGRVTIENNDRAKCYTLTFAHENGSRRLMHVPHRHFEKLQSTIWKFLSESDLMAKYIEIGNGSITVEDPAAQVVLSIAYLREAFDDELLKRTSQIEKSLSDEQCNYKHATLSRKDQLAIAEHNLNVVTEADVNHFLRFSSCRIKTGNPSEALANSLLKDRFGVLDRVLHKGITPAMNYFQHLLQCNEEILSGEGGLC